MKRLLSLWTLLLCAVMGTWADTVVLGTPSESVTTLSDANGIVTITDASGSTGIQQGSGSYKITYDGTAYVPMKLSGSRNFTLSYKEGVTISKVTLMAMSNGDAEGTVGAGDGDAASLGTFPARNADGNCLTVDITGKTGLRGSRQFLALLVVEYTEAPATKTVTFVNDANWEKVNVWAWNDKEDGAAFMGTSWPGVEITPVEGVYTWSTTKSPTYIIFNDGGSNKTADQDFVDGATYNSNGRVIVLNDYTATLTTDMETVYAYVWSGDGDAATNKILGEWPGTELTATDGIYNVAFQAENAPEHIIFHNNAGIQTENLTFENGKAYEFYKQNFTVTFTTDADWKDNAYVYAWTDDKVYTEAWPGTKLENAVDGVYTFSIEAYAAPQKIQFNGGTDETKAGDWNFVNGKAYKYITATPLFAIQAGVTYTYGQTVEVKDAEEEVVATITFGNEGEEGSDFRTTVAQTIEGYTGYVAQTNGGNNTNGNAQTGGTTYTIKPKYDGQLSIAVKVGGTKKFHLLEDGVAVAAHDGFTPEETFFGTIDFDVTAGKAYKFYCDGSKLDIFGFDYKFTKPAVEITSMTIVGDFLGLETEDENFNPANGWPMTQDAENPAVWTLVKEDVVIEGKQYNYKATANGKYGDYELPAEGNNNWVFGTDEYPAGTYTLTFTANTEENTLTLTPVKQEDPVEGETVTFDFVANEWKHGLATSTLDKTDGLFTDVLSKDGVDVFFGKGEGSDPYYYDNNGNPQVRIVKNNYVKVYAPAGKAIKQITFEAEGTYFNMTADGMAEKTWKGNATLVKFTATGTNRLTKMNVVVADADDATVTPEAESTYAYIDLSDADDPLYSASTVTLSEDKVVTYKNGLLTVTYQATKNEAAASKNRISYTNSNWCYMQAYTDQLIFEVPADKAITKIVFADGFKRNLTWNAANTINGQAYTAATLKGDGWQGNSHNVIVEFAGLTNMQDITVYIADKTAETTTYVAPNAYYATFKTDAEWEEVYAYTWSGEGDSKVEQLGAWPGTKLTKNINTYNVTVKAFEAPEYIIFNNGQDGEGNQTEDFTFEDGKAYSYTMPVYTIVGAYGTGKEAEAEDDVFGKAWSLTEENNNLIKGANDIYTLALSEVNLENTGTIYYKVVKNNSWDNNWGFGNENAEYNISESGKYNITFTFNPNSVLDNGYNVSCTAVRIGDATGISSLKAAELQGAAIYNLQGQRMEQPVKGLNIVNGRKVVVK